jgi:hypothetical protein
MPLMLHALTAPEKVAKYRNHSALRDARTTATLGP